MRKSAETIHERSADADSKQGMSSGTQRVSPDHAPASADLSAADLTERELLADPGVAACLDRLAARWPRPQLKTPPPVLQRLGRFEIRRELGRGRFGVVFLAWDPNIERPVALKVPQFDAALDSELRERFRGEAQAAGKLRHPGIVPVYEVGQHAGVDYLAMALIDGQTLADRLQNGPLPPADAARLIIALATAIQHAHDEGVIHRDLKPSNVLLDKKDRPHVADFGLARRLSESAVRATATGQVLGTPAYMPPEQATGETNIGPPSDIYALGVILYESITGRPPFQAATFVEAVEFILNRDPLPPSKLNPKLPRELDAITFKCLEKRQDARYASAADLADDLQRYLDGRPIRARAQGPVQRTARWARKNPASALLILAVACAVGLLLTTAGIYDRWLHATELADQQEKIADQQRQNAAAQEQIAKTQTQIAETERRRAAAEHSSAATERYFSSVNLARNHSTRRLPGWREATSSAVSTAAGVDCAARDPLELRALATDALSGFDVKQIAKLNAGMSVGRIAISPDGQSLAVGELKGTAACRVTVYDLPQRTVKHSFSIMDVRQNISRLLYGEIKWQDGVRQFAFSSDSRYLAVGLRFGNIYCFDLHEPEKPPRQLTVSKERELDLLAFSADGEALFCLTKDEEFIRWQHWQTDDSYDSPWSTRPRCFAVPPAGRDLFVQNQTPGGVWLLDQELQKRKYFSSGAQLPKADDSRMTTDAAGHLIASKNWQGIRVYEARTGYLVRRLQDDTVVDDVVGYNLAMTGDGQVLSALADDGVVRLFDVQRGQQVLKLEVGRHELQDMALDRQGKWLVVSVDETLLIWQLHQSPIRRLLTSAADEVQDIRFSPDGTLACTARNGGLSGPEEYNLLTFRPDGTLLAQRTGGYEHSALHAGDSQLAWLPAGDRLLWCGKFGARVVNLDETQSPVDRWLPLYGEVLPVDWNAAALVQGGTITSSEVPHPHNPERRIRRIIPDSHDFKLHCQLPHPVKLGAHFPTLSFSLRIDCEPSALPVLQLQQRFGEQHFPGSAAPRWAISSRSGDFFQWTVELQNKQEFSEFELVITKAAGVRAIEIESLDYVAFARQSHPIASRRVIQQINFLGIAPQADRVWGCVNEGVYSWSLATGEQLSEWHNPQHSLSKSGNVRCLVVGEQGTLVGTRSGGLIWLDPTTGTTRAVWTGPGKEVVCAALCEQAGMALVAGETGKVRAIGLATNETLFDLATEDSAVVALAATSDGRTFVTASANRTLRLWNLVQENGRPARYELFCQLPDTVVPVKSLALSPDGSRLAVLTSTTGSVVMWDLPALAAELRQLGIE